MLADAQAHGLYPVGNGEPERAGAIRSLHCHTEDGLEEGWL